MKKLFIFALSVTTLYSKNLTNTHLKKLDADRILKEAIAKYEMKYGNIKKHKDNITFDQHFRTHKKTKRHNKKHYIDTYYPPNGYWTEEREKALKKRKDRIIGDEITINGKKYISASSLNKKVLYKIPHPKKYIAYTSSTPNYIKFIKLTPKKHNFLYFIFGRDFTSSSSKLKTSSGIGIGYQTNLNESLNIRFGYQYYWMTKYKNTKFETDINKYYSDIIYNITNIDSFTPYVGFGIGLKSINNEELGVKSSFSFNSIIGIKYDFYSTNIFIEYKNELLSKSTDKNINIGISYKF